MLGFSGLVSLNLKGLWAHTLIATGYLKQPQSESQSPKGRKRGGCVMNATLCGRDMAWGLAPGAIACHAL